VFDDGVLADKDVARALVEKHGLVNRSRVLHLDHDTARFADVGGLERLKRWLEQRRAAFDGSAPHLDPPKGVLLLGVQGCGKSLVARAVAGLYRIPLLKLDAASLYDKWHGESERNLREALQVADAMSPCTLWIDEIEKAFATGDGDSGTSRRLLGGFLTWLAERRTRVFVVATANSIDDLPPELVRKGRFDEIFFVDLPDERTRAEILGIHAHRRALALSEADARALAARSDGYSGAELEQAIVAATYHAHARGEPASAAHVLHELRATRPLATVMGERVAALRAWASERTVPAN
jgi:SpoVK/Ycf46/Vps4 family AAA+-type ATPase